MSFGAPPSIDFAGVPTILNGVGYDDGANAAMSQLLTKRTRPMDDLNTDMRRLMPRVASSATYAGTGFANAQHSGYHKVVDPLLVRPWADYPTIHSEGTVLFLSKQDHAMAGHSVAADVPMLNFLLEEAAMLQSQSRTGGRAQGYLPRLVMDMKARAQRYEPFYAHTPQEFVTKWSRLPALVQTRFNSLATANPQRAQSYGVSYGGVGNMFNMFGDVKRGSQLYFVLRKKKLRGPDVLSPEGQPLDSRINSDRNVLQLEGVSSDSNFQPFVDTSIDSPAAFKNYIMGNTRDTDINYVSREAQAAAEYKEFEYDEFSGRWYDRTVATDQGLQEQLANIPTADYEVYQQGDVIKVGVSKSVQLEHNMSRVQAGHRSREKMRHLSKIEVMLNLKF